MHSTPRSGKGSFSERDVCVVYFLGIFTIFKCISPVLCTTKAILYCISTGFIENLSNYYFRVSKFIPQTPKDSNENALRTSFVPQTSIHLIPALSHIFCVTRSHNLFVRAAALLPHRPKTSPPVPLDPAHVPPHSGKLEHMRNGSAHGHAASAPARGAPKQPPAHLVLPLYFG